MDRRNFFKLAGGAALLANSGFCTLCKNLYSFSEKANLSHVEARYYKKLPHREIECHLCPRLCKLGDKERGYCGVRENDGGTYYSLVYGKPCATHIDPIEKKPLFHFLPGTPALSIATAGCNVHCKFCQNWEISQMRPEQVHNIDLSPPLVVQTAKKYNSPVIAYTYTEPVVFFEYMYDTSKQAQKEGVKNAVITAAHIKPEPLQDLTQVVEAIKIDLKAFHQKFYTDYVRGELQPVLDSIKLVSKTDTWLEIVYLVIPTLNDNAEEIKNLSQWLMKEVGPDVPLHFSRFQPMYLLKNLPPTPISTLERCRNIALNEGLNYVYIGNVPGHKAENTFCPECKKIVIKRVGYRIQEINLKQGNCKFCHTPIAGIWS